MLGAVPASLIAGFRPALACTASAVADFSDAVEARIAVPSLSLNLPPGTIAVGTVVLGLTLVAAAAAMPTFFAAAVAASVLSKAAVAALSAAYGVVGIAIGLYGVALMGQDAEGR
jgi:Ca2+/Na+ antiporter